MDRNEPSPPRRGVARWLLAGIGSLLLLGFCLFCAFVLGAIYGELGAYHRRYLEEREAIAPALAKDPSFTNVEIKKLSSGGVFLIGVVPTPQDLERLQAAVARVLGEKRSKEVVNTQVGRP